MFGFQSFIFNSQNHIFFTYFLKSLFYFLFFHKAKPMIYFCLVMRNYLTIRLPVSSYIKKFLVAVYGDAYRVSVTDDFGILILNILQKKSIYYKYNRKNDDRNTNFSIHISFSNFEKYGCVISEQQLYQINKSLDSNFRTTMYRNAIINFHSFGVQYKKSILAYLNSYGITEEEMKYTSVRKDFNRKKGAIESKLRLKGHI